MCCKLTQSFRGKKKVHQYIFKAIKLINFSSHLIVKNISGEKKKATCIQRYQLLHIVTTKQTTQRVTKYQTVTNLENTWIMETHENIKNKF